MKHDATRSARTLLLPMAIAMALLSAWSVAAGDWQFVAFSLAVPAGLGIRALRNRVTEVRVRS